MYKKNPFETDTRFEISKHENEIFWHLNDLRNKTHPLHLDEEGCDVYCDDCRSADNSNGILLNCHGKDLWEFHDKVECAYLFIFKQILINHNRSHLIPLIPKMNKVAIYKLISKVSNLGITKVDNPEGPFFMYISGVDE